MRPEGALLLALCRGDADGVRAVPWDAIDVDVTRRLARDHQVEALCSWRWRGLLATSPELAPPASHALLATEWRQLYLHHLLRNEHLCGQLAELQEALSKRGVQALVLKGPWVAYGAYPDPGTRPITDIDLCVGERDHPVVLEALGTIGYHVPAELPASPERALRGAHYGRQLRFEGAGKRMLELHFRLVNIGPPTDEGWVWEHAEPLALPCGSITVPGPEAMLLHLLLHANQHGFSVLRLLYDVRFALESLRDRLDWSQLVERLRALRCTTSAHQTLVLASELAGAEVPSEALAELCPSWSRRRLFSALWSLPAVRRLEAPRRRTETEAPRLFLLEMGGPFQKARYLVNILREAGGVADLVRAARRSRTRGMGSASGPSP